LKAFEDALVYVKQTWLLSKTSQQFARLDAINGKYERQSVVNVRAIWPPIITHSMVENWIYSKENDLMETT